jgi:hypothetical protein
MEDLPPLAFSGDFPAFFDEFSIDLMAFPGDFLVFFGDFFATLICLFFFSKHKVTP